MITIERAAPADAEVILDIQKRAFAAEARLVKTLDIPPMAETLDAVVEQIAHACVLKAVDNRRIVGSIRGVVAGTLCTIHRLSVDDPFRGNGLGSALLSALERAHPTVLGFDLHTNATIDSNVRFYVRHGYRVAATVHHSENITLAYMTKQNASTAGT